MTESHPTKLMPLARVTALFGYLDTPNFRQSVAPRLGLPIFKVGRRWFAPVTEVDRVFGVIVSAPSPGPEKKD